MASIIIPIPNLDFDPSEVAIPWKILSELGHQIVFATPDGRQAEADPQMLSGEGLDFWGFIPVLKKMKVLGLSLRANADARHAYRLMRGDEAFCRPLAYSELKADDYDGLLLPGGHRARGMLAYLENEGLHHFVAEFFDAGKPVAAICHGVLVAARSISARSGKSVLFGRQTTALTWKLENAAWSLMKYAGRFWDAAYYRTYLEDKDEPAGYWSVEAEVKRALARISDFQDVAKTAPGFFRKTSGLFRDSATDDSPAFVVVDGNYVSARWPGDVHRFATVFADLLKKQAADTLAEASAASMAATIQRINRR
ncbi:type 1 glutamine amidotransferase domain-containing protein [Undibacterium sp.]|jgi:putative intracellular protease/amidase|uniref:type 1 glutamine amidotransferase domain-containing protein n=1 Tax=Undibacterium sp. TaxID=1914977 RepID=UPI002B5EBE8E|nr:type 1 glutamine amidotransferase domain-containing protein [Undibacterium sp.]HTD07201.1 type 1 glutamine amidotransferase domain-containing protein [Undibacterium sp.]